MGSRTVDQSLHSYTLGLSRIIHLVPLVHAIIRTYTRTRTYVRASMLVVSDVQLLAHGCTVIEALSSWIYGKKRAERERERGRANTCCAIGRFAAGDLDSDWRRESSVAMADGRNDRAPEYMAPAKIKRSGQKECQRGREKENWKAFS